ncbi:hypothetical protein P4O66_005367 [Electrophorus voltai]|uniref:Uncharacterized protein n=2 Tax=Electrophorus TaxID=8004 RepID=A0AAY5E9B2_ELEEL|nr:uncharacterized protein C9orf85 homolog [Electrophorus electricus]KAK1806884.1 hypothetical protein P4O66_005367 [Electrophorus voltai]
MSSQRGGECRSRSQKHQNRTAFKNDKYGASPQVKKANAKVHDGLCQRCTEILEWRVKYNKYKFLTQPRKCVKCLQKTVKDAYHIMCKSCALSLELCAKCGKKEEIVITLGGAEGEEPAEAMAQHPQGSGNRTADSGWTDDEEAGDSGERDSAAVGK